MSAPRILAAALISLGIIAAASVSSAQTDPTVAGESAPDAQSSRLPATISLPDDPDTLMLEALQYRGAPSDDPSEPEPEPYRWRFFGNGRLEISPYPGGVEAHRILLEPIVLQQLLHSIDQLYDLPAHQTTAPPNPDQSFVAVQIDRYVNQDWTVAVDYLNVVLVHDLETFFEELHALRQWIVLSDPNDPIWFSGNPWPSICRPTNRDLQGLSGPETTWCQFLRERSESKAGPLDDSEARELVRERLRQRLRNLPRG